jgi:hypothetical protein
MKKKIILHENVSSYSANEPKAMLEVVGQWMMGDLKEHYPESEGYQVDKVVSSGSEPPITARWDISLSRGQLWRFKLVLEILRGAGKTFFHVSIAPDIDRNGLCFMFGMILSLIGILWASGQTAQPYTSDLIVPVLIGSVIGGLILSLPIRWVVNPYVMAKARRQGIEASESRLTEEIKEVLRHAGHVV